MPKISVVDISDPNKIQELVNDEDQDINNGIERDNDSDSDGSDDGVVPRILFSTFSSLTALVPLVSVHIALDIIVHQQYAQEFDVVEIAARAGTAAIGISVPFITFLLFLIGAVHPRKETPILRSAMFCAFLALGVAMIRVSRDGSYYAVMKRAPGIGTLLIFCAVELQIPECVVGLVLLGIYAWWHGNGKLF